MREILALAARLGRRSLPALCILASIGLAGGGAYLGLRWLTSSEQFRISKLKLSGNQQLDSAAVASLLALPADANIFRTDMDGLEERLESSPWIAEAEVSRDLPGRLEIEIREERAVAAVELDGLYLLNEEAEPFKRARVRNQELVGLPIITGIARGDFLDSPERSQERLRYALTALRSYASGEERPRIGELHLDERHGITLITFEDAIAIHLGRPQVEDLDDRYQAFDSAWQALDGEELAAARAFRIADRTPSDRVTVAFAGN